MPAVDLASLKKKISEFPRKTLIHRPTPLRRLDRLTQELGGPEIWIKRDDLTGLAFGGNKSRKLEFIIADALDKGADAIVTWAGIQSNWCLQTAAAARKYGLRPILLLFNTTPLEPEDDGNLLLDRILDADVRIHEAEKGKIVSQEAVNDALNKVVDEAKERGQTPYAVSIGGSMTGWSMTQPLGAIAYLDAFIETFEQTNEAGAAPTHVVHATGSGSTQAGLAVGAEVLPGDVRVVGISVSESRDLFVPVIRRIIRETAESLRLDIDPAESEITIYDEYVKGGYGNVDKETAEAIRLVFVIEGIVLDPVYTGKAMAALIDLVRKGHFRKDDRILFFHTGGTPALFPYRKPLVDFLS
ncbi:MAG: D-cysteine desulfhydrase family protein [Candidatus Aminicenantes bacterium]|nr:D-cysteine desulfhydrase family protein [Candidatus Aminicenantes bacterium]